MNITFVLDSASDYCAEHHSLSVPLAVVPLNITFGADHFLDGETISTDMFYERMAKEEHLPKPASHLASLFECIPKRD